MGRLAFMIEIQNASLSIDKFLALKLSMRCYSGSGNQQPVVARQPCRTIPTL